MRDERIMKDLIKIILSENLLWKIYYLIRVVDDGLWKISAKKSKNYLKFQKKLQKIEKLVQNSKILQKIEKLSINSKFIIKSRN